MDKTKELETSFNHAISITERKSIIISVKRFIGNIMFWNGRWSCYNISKGNYKIIINVRIDK